MKGAKNVLTQTGRIGAENMANHLPKRLRIEARVVRLLFRIIYVS